MLQLAVARVSGRRPIGWRILCNFCASGTTRDDCTWQYELSLNDAIGILARIRLYMDPAYFAGCPFYNKANLQLKLGYAYGFFRYLKALDDKHKLIYENINRSA
eukprot:6179418-Pleurochrysis_carterae.AAC.1